MMFIQSNETISTFEIENISTQYLNQMVY